MCDNIECLVEKHTDCHFVIGGDLNADFNRGNAHDKYFQSVMDRHSLRLGWTLDSAAQDFTFNNVSVIDHYSFSDFLCSKMIKREVVHNAFNSSGHSPIVMCIDIQTSREQQSSCQVNDPERIAWHKESNQHIHSYKCELDKLISQVPFYDVKIFCVKTRIIYWRSINSVLTL